MPPTPSASQRFAVLAISLVASAGCVWWLLGSRAEPRGVEVVGIDNALREIYRKRASHDAAAQPSSTDTDGLPSLVREPIDEATAKVLFPAISTNAIFDAALYYRRASNLSRRFKMPEYPGGGYTIRTNSLGMREDSEPLATQPDWRVLVTGASNVECVCDNSVSATNLIEAALRERMPSKAVEALNTGVGAYSLYNDLAVLEHYRGLNPDVFVVIVYGGNDFFGCARLQRYFNHRGLPNEGPHRNAGLEGTDKFTRELGGTETTQVNYFLNNPGDVEIALGTVCALTAEMERICRADNIRFVCAYLPPPLCGQPQFLADTRATLMERMQLEPADLEISDRLADQWLTFLAKRKIAHVDLRPTFHASPERLYWTTDTHVNLAGQRVIAEALMPFVQPIE